MGCYTNINQFTALQLLSIWNLIARQNLPMPTKGSYLNLITSGSNIWTFTSITPSITMLLLFQYYTLAELHGITSSNFRSACPLENHYQPFQRGVRILNNIYYVLKLRNMRWWFQQRTKIHMVGLIVLMSSFRYSNTLIQCILFQLEQLFERQIWWTIVNRIVWFDINIITITLCEFASRFEVHRNCLGDMANSSNSLKSSNICTF